MNTASPEFNFVISQPTSEALNQHVRNRFTAALNQHATHVKQVVFRFDDQNGPKGGEDLKLRVVVTLHRIGRLNFEDLGQDAYALVSKVADRVKQTVGRELGKRKPQQR